MSGASVLRLYNTLTKREEEFMPINDKNVLIYTCGPTVYGRPHIGNYSSFLMADLLRRWLEVKGYKVTHAKNITDVGHLVADRDEGEDKVERQAKAENVDPLEIARKYETQYLEDEKALNMREPEVRPRATETVKEMLAMVKELLANGHAYETEDGIYFDVRTFPAYGKLSGNTVENLEAGARVAVKEAKKHPADFALWKKAVGGNARHLLRWEFATGERAATTGEDPSSGFPGWHIECSAMSRKHLGPQIDIHTGGEDNIFPHHESEIAQSESTGPAPFARYWVHKRRIDMGDVKMSKSLGNILTVPDIEKMGFSPLDLRYYLLSVHYRTNLKFSKKGLEDAQYARKRILAWMKEVDEGRLVGFAKPGDAGLYPDPLEDYQRLVAEHEKQFDDAMNDDLNVSAALASVFHCMGASRNLGIWTNDALLPLRRFIQKIRDTFGCFEPEKEVEVEVPAEVQKLLEERAEARARKDFAASDRLRGEIEGRGFTVKDTPEGQKLAKK
ncbi:MAG: cysteine--tRNA ligase [Candidatus Peribacteraceae bacterium]|jgi:cysteinyl-tRNA synthetase